MFHALLDAYEESSLSFENSTQVADWFIEQPGITEAMEELGADQLFTACLKESISWLPPLSDWAVPEHEVQLVGRIAQLSRTQGAEPVGKRREIVIAAVRTLLALACRTNGRSNSYGELVFDDRYFSYYPINLQSFDFHKTNTWSNLNLREVFRWLLVNWGIDVHLRVALRKLRGQSQSTFRIRPSDRGLEVTTVPPAVHTRPRFNQAVRVLKDIGALEQIESGVWRPSELGLAALELGDAP